MKRSKRIRALIVDDERPARNHVLRLLHHEPDVDIVAEATSGTEALKAIQTHRPDLLFLDIQMPEMDGFEVLRATLPEDRPVTIFVTAYDQYALAAFDAHAVDYLLKPYGDKRFEVALERARRFLASGPEMLHRRVQALLNHVEDVTHNPSPPTPPPPSTYLDRLVLKQQGHLRLLPVEQIQWIEAAGVYVKLHTTHATILHRALLGHLEQQLNPRWFVRVHRSAIVKVDAIATLVPDAHGEYAVVLKDQTRLKLTRTYRPHLEARLNQTL